MNDKEVTDSLRTLTTCEEKSKRFDFINDKFMTKYLDLVWFARSDPDKMIEEEKYEMVKGVLKSLQDIHDKYPDEVESLLEDDSNWQHGFNSGVLAYSRFLASYLEDTLWEVDEDNREIAENEKVIIIDGVQYMEMDGRSDAEESFPELYT